MVIYLLYTSINNNLYKKIIFYFKLLFLFIYSDLLREEIKEIKSFLNFKETISKRLYTSPNSRIKIISLNEVEA